MPGGIDLGAAARDRRAVRASLPLKDCGRYNI
jgi:hypothetical protein